MYFTIPNFIACKVIALTKALKIDSKEVKKKRSKLPNTLYSKYLTEKWISIFIFI